MSIYEDVFNPSTFDEYVGQEKAKQIINVMLDAAEREERLYPNFLLCGTAGLGKTSLGKLIFNGLPYTFIDGSAVNAHLDTLRGFVIIDEIHNLKPDTADSMNIFIDEGRIIIVGCTTNPGTLPGPFRSRFQIINLLPYTEQELVIIMRNVLDRKGGMDISDEFLLDIAKRGRETPRVTLKYLSFVMDLMVVNDETTLTRERLDDAFNLLGVDNDGLLDIDHRYLAALSDTPVGVQHLSAVLSLDKETIEQEIEPYLLHLGLIDRTKQGRVKIMNEADMERFVETLFA